jgi:hypothetical protein
MFRITEQAEYIPKITAFWDKVPCSLIEVDVSEVHIASIFRVISLMMKQWWITA